MPIRPALAIAIATAALLLRNLPVVAAHGDDMDMSAHDAPPTPTQDGGPPRSYWSLSEHVGLMAFHVGLEILAWVVILPVGKLSQFDCKTLVLTR